MLAIHYGPKSCQCANFVFCQPVFLYQTHPEEKVAEQACSFCIILLHQVAKRLTPPWVDLPWTLWHNLTQQSKSNLFFLYDIFPPPNTEKKLVAMWAYWRLTAFASPSQIFDFLARHWKGAKILQSCWCLTLIHQNEKGRELEPT